jgi:hypothetical protein
MAMVVSGSGVVSFPSAYANPRLVGEVGEGRLRTINLVRRAGWPPHPLYSAATGAHRSQTNGRPDQGAREGVERAIGLVPIEINLTNSSS